MIHTKKVIFITGSEYSGINMLGKMLSTVEDALFLGEVQRCRFGDKMVCLSCGFDCPIWKDFKWRREDSTYELITQKSGKTIIIDSTKKPVSWIAEQTELLTKQEINWALILLMRDPRGVIASELQKKPYKAVNLLAETWRIETGAREKLFRNLSALGTVARTSYEDLVTFPEKTLRTICESIDLPFNEKMLSPFNVLHHKLVVVDKKPILKRAVDTTHQRAVARHDTWKEELSESINQEIGNIAGALFSLYNHK
jgi:hypothetical protein